MIPSVVRVASTALLGLAPYAACLAIDMGKRLDIPLWERIARTSAHGTGATLLGIGVAAVVGAFLSERSREPRRRARAYMWTCLVVAALCALLPTQGIGVLMVPVALIVAVVWERIGKRG